MEIHKRSPCRAFETCPCEASPRPCLHHVVISLILPSSHQDRSQVRCIGCTHMTNHCLFVTQRSHQAPGIHKAFSHPLDDPSRAEPPLRLPQKA